MFLRLLTNIRFYVLVFAVLLSIGYYVWVFNSTETNQLVIIKLTRLYALTAVGFLYIALLIGPVVHLFSFMPYKAKLIHARRAVGVSAFYFSMLHANLAFFGQLGGFGGLFFLPGKYLLAISFSATALLILSLMAATSFDFMVKKLTFVRWKKLHRLVYIAGTLIVVHALMIGTHFQDLYSPVAQISFVLVALLLILEAMATDKYFALTRSNFPRFGVSTIVVFGFMLWFLVLILPNIIHLHYFAHEGLTVHSERWDWYFGLEHLVHYIGTSIAVVFLITALILKFIRKGKV